MERRKFIEKSSVLALGCCVGGQLMASCATTAQYAEHTLEGNSLSINLSEFGNNKFVIVNESSTEGPIYVKKDGDSYTAISMICTHRGCTLDPAGDILVCPCHGAEFSNTGKVLNRPANTDLKKYEVEIKGDKILVKLG